MKRIILPMLAIGMGILLAVLPVTVAAQSIWTGPDAPQGFSVEWLRPEFADLEDVSFISSALYVSGRLDVRENLSLVADVPFAYFDADLAPGGSVSDVAVGNPYLGLELSFADRPFWAEAGVRVPLTPDNEAATFPGVYSDFDRCEAFTPDVLSVMAMGNYRLEDPSGFSVRLRVGPALWVNTNPDAFEDDLELYALYSAQGWYDASRARFGAGLTGRFFVTEKDLNLSERTVHHLGLALVGKFPGVYPGLHFRLPLDEDLPDILDFAVGLSVTVPVR